MTAFDIARVAHWLLNDSGYTKKRAAKELALIARRLEPSLTDRDLGDAAALIREDGVDLGPPVLPARPGVASPPDTRPWQQTGYCAKCGHPRSVHCADVGFCMVCPCDTRGFIAARTDTEAPSLQRNEEDSA